METSLVGVPIRVADGLSRLLIAVEESLRVGRSVFCPRCGMVHHTIVFNAGAELPCSRCKLTLVVPEAKSKIIDIPPLPDLEV